MKIAVIGTGYIGLVSGVCLAKLGHSVICVDKDVAKINLLQQGKVPIFEPGLLELMDEVRATGRLHFTTDTVAATRTSDAVFIAVGTPTDARGLSPDLTYVFAAAKEIAKGLEGYKVVVVKSTVPTGTVRKVESEIRSLNPKADFDVVSNPEFLREGVAVFDFMNPDRIVIGTASQRARAVMDEMYLQFSSRNIIILHTGIESAELIKFASNSFLATKIAFINEMAELCEKIGANVQDVSRGMGLDDRIGPKFLNAGPGFGGSCFPKDNRALTAMANSVGVQLRVTESVVDSNNHAKNRVIKKVVELAGQNISGSNIVVFGVTFKPDTDDMREAPSLTIVPELIARGAHVTVVDPEGRRQGEDLLPDVIWEMDPYKAAIGADMIIVLTEWHMFRTINLSALAASMKRPMMADLRNVYAADALEEAGFVRVYSIGQG
jgi:UDPglucose 6-dehydrogenase